MSWFGKKEQNIKEEIIKTPEQVTKRAIVVWFIGCENGFIVNCDSKELALETYELLKEAKSKNDKNSFREIQEDYEEGNVMILVSKITGFRLYSYTK